MKAQGEHITASLLDSATRVVRLRHLRRVMIGIVWPVCSAAPDLLTLLSAIEDQPNRETLEAAGVDSGGQILADFARDKARSEYVRQRAAAALALLPSPKSLALLRELCAERELISVRVQAILALAHREGAPAVPELRAWLFSPEPHIRAAAAEALCLADQRRAEPILRAHLKSGESERWVRGSIERKLVRLAAASARPASLVLPAPSR